MTWHFPLSLSTSFFSTTVPMSTERTYIDLAFPTFELPVVRHEMSVVDGVVGVRRLPLGAMRRLHGKPAKLSTMPSSGIVIHRAFHTPGISHTGHFIRQFHTRIRHFTHRAFHQAMSYTYQAFHTPGISSGNVIHVSGISHTGHFIRHFHTRIRHFTHQVHCARTPGLPTPGHPGSEI